HRPGEVLGLHRSNERTDLYPLILNFTGVYIPAGITRRGGSVDRNNLINGVGAVPSHIKSKKAIEEVQFHAGFHTLLSFWKEVAVISRTRKGENRNGSKSSLRTIHIIDTQCGRIITYLGIVGSHFTVGQPRGLPVLGKYIVGGHRWIKIGVIVLRQSGGLVLPC